MTTRFDIPHVAAICVGLVVAVIAPSTAEAEDVHLPIVGNQFPTVGLDMRAGPILDWSDDEFQTAVVVGPRARVGLQHVITERFSMNAEAAIGASYLTDHPVAFEDGGDSEISFVDFSAAALGRYMAIGPGSGWTFAGGAHYRRASLDVGSLIQFGIEGRIGYHVWTSDERFFIVELGLHAPLIEGLSVPQRTQQQYDDEAPQDAWYFPSASLGIQWAF